jgi:hypothetical protein
MNTESQPEGTVYVKVPGVVYVVGPAVHAASARSTGTKRPIEITTVKIRRRRRSSLFSAFFLTVGGSPAVPRG